MFSMFLKLIIYIFLAHMCNTPIKNACACNKKQWSISMAFPLGCCDHNILCVTMTITT